jgi:hypothetical protein
MRIVMVSPPLVVAAPGSCDLEAAGRARLRVVATVIIFASSRRGCKMAVMQRHRLAVASRPPLGRV